MSVCMCNFQNSWDKFLPESSVYIGRCIDAETIDIKSSNPTRPKINLALQHRWLLGKKVVQSIEITIKVSGSIAEINIPTVVIVG